MPFSGARLILDFVESPSYRPDWLLIQYTIETYSDGERESCLVVLDSSELFHLEDALSQFLIEHIGLQTRLL